MAAINVGVAILLFQTLVGVVGNSCLLYHYVFLYCMKFRLKPTDLIVVQLTIGNFLTVLCKAVPQTMAAFSWKGFLSDIGFKLLIYLNKVGRSVSTFSTCFLSVFQAITISPFGSWWAELKVKASSYIVFSICLSWTVSLIVNISYPMFMTGASNNQNNSNLKVFGFYAAVRHDKTSDILYVASLTIPDVLCLGLMLWSSSSMLFILYRHKKKMQHMHRTSVSLRSSPESRATKSILFLVIAFVCLYTAVCLIQAFAAIVLNPSSFLIDMSTIFSGCFPSVSPFLLMNCETSKSLLCFACIKNKNKNLVM